MALAQPQQDAENQLSPARRPRPRTPGGGFGDIRLLLEGGSSHRPAISQRTVDLIDALALSLGMRLADALIGATAIEHGLTLLTANVKHFGAPKGLQLEAFIP